MAAKLGYRPDPLLSALTRRRWPGGAKPSFVTIAYVHFSGSGRNKSAGPREEAIAVRARAAELGYNLDVLDYSSYHTGKKLSDVLVARGVRGVIVQAFTDTKALELDWNRFFTVFVGPENDEIHVHNVQADFRATVRVAVQECVARGYRRPGFALMNYLASGTNEPIYAQVLAERSRLEASDGEQPDLFQWSPGDPRYVQSLHKWYADNRPDCLIASHPSVYHAFCHPEHFGYPRIPAVRIPEDLPMVSLRKDPTVGSMAHTGLREHEQGVEAVNLIHRHLQHGVVGIPSVPMRMLIPPEFIAGSTLPNRLRRTRKSCARHTRKV